MGVCGVLQCPCVISWSRMPALVWVPLCKCLDLPSNCNIVLSSLISLVLLLMVFKRVSFSDMQISWSAFLFSLVFSLLFRLLFWRLSLTLPTPQFYQRHSFFFVICPGSCFVLVLLFVFLVCVLLRSCLYKNCFNVIISLYISIIIL